MRFCFYVIAGIALALIGWSLSQLILMGWSTRLGEGLIPFPPEFMPEFILLPTVAVALALAMVTTEIFLSNPTRYRANRRVLPPYLRGAVLTGIGSGLVAAGVSWVLYKIGVSPTIVRIAGWSLVGLFIGLGEGISWRFRSIEGATQRANQRLIRSTVLGFCAGLAAAILVELIRYAITMGGYEDPIGFALLGLLLGACLSWATAPTYQVALRAGEGFEAIDPQFDRRRDLPQIQLPLEYVTGGEDQFDFIEEGLSISLPNNRNETIELLIGSDRASEIYIPHLPPEAAKLQIKKGNVYLLCRADRAVQVQSRPLSRGKAVSLRHNQILTFYHDGDPDRYYRFVFYDRFLDPEA
jgi:hypothetical protein